MEKKKNIKKKTTCTVSKKTPEHLKPWMNHLCKVRTANPKKSLKDQMQIAKKSYKKK